MADKNFPGPNINRLIEKDPQIVKIPLDTMGWGSTPAVFSQLSPGVSQIDPNLPAAPEITIKHIASN